jgi:chloride channel 7
MLTAMTAKVVGDMFNHPLYDLLIGAQHIPFLESDPAPLYDLLRVSDVMSNDVHCLPAVTTVKQAAQLLSSTTHNGFPVVDPSQPHCFRGIILRSQLMVLLEQQVWDTGREFTNQDFQWLMMSNKKDIDDLDFAKDDWDKQLDLRPYINRSPFSVQPDFSLSVAFRLFRAMGLRHLVVVDVHNIPVGMITRKDLLDPIVEAKHAQLLELYRTFL